MKTQIDEFSSAEISMRKMRLYGIYSGMKQRCYNPNNQHYKTYGKRGIEICSEWLGENGLQNFIFWSLDNGYNDDLTIDRIDNDKGYSPDNCQWVTRSYNASKSNSKLSDVENNFTSAGAVIRKLLLSSDMTHAELAQKLGIQPQSLANKILRGDMPVQDFIKILNCLGYQMYTEYLPDTRLYFTMNDIQKKK